jgi:hypothetical protein
MNYDRLIDRLAEDLKPVRRRRLGWDIFIVAVICAGELAVFFALGLARPDMPMMMQQPTVWWRLASLGLISVISGSLAIRSFNPVYSPRLGIRWLAVIVAICLVFGFCISAGPHSLDAIVQRLNWRDGLQCASKMIALSMPPLVGLSVLMHRGAPTDTSRTALLVGLAAAAWGAFVFVFACPFDDPLYIAAWYSVGCGSVTLLARLVLPRFTAW